jgi:hypothetical protein
MWAVPARAQLLDKTGVKPREVDALITNCCTFNPVPSLSAAVVNHFKFKQSVKTYHLGGMGCAASVIAMDLAHELLQACARLAWAPGPDGARTCGLRPAGRGGGAGGQPNEALAARSALPG